MSDQPGQDWEAFSPNEEPNRSRVGVPEYIVAVIGVLIVVGIIVLWPSGSAKEIAAAEFSVLGVPSQFHEAVVTDATTAPCPATPERDCIAVTF